MKKLVVFAMVAMSLTIFNGCQKDELVFQSADEQLQEAVKPDVYVEGDYLVFSDFESYAEMSDKIDLMDEEQFTEWEKELGFYSAHSLLNDVYKKLDLIETEENYFEVKKEYEGRIIFTPDKDILLPFYATAWEKVLNPKGEMKIGHTLYKFYRDREIMIMDGTIKDLSNLSIILSDTNKVRVFYPNKSDLLKSVQWGSLISGSPQIGNFRLEYNYQLISLYYTGYGYGSTYYTENGFELKHSMRQKHKSIWWSYNSTQYYFTNINLHIEFWKMYDGLNIYPKYVYNQSPPNWTSSETTQGCTYLFMRYYDVLTGFHSQVIPEIHNNSFTFWSRGWDYNNRLTINYSNL